MPRPLIAVIVLVAAFAAGTALTSAQVATDPCPRPNGAACAYPMGLPTPTPRRVNAHLDDAELDRIAVAVATKLARP